MSAPITMPKCTRVAAISTTPGISAQPRCGSGMRRGSSCPPIAQKIAETSPVPMRRTSSSSPPSFWTNASARAAASRLSFASSSKSAVRATAVVPRSPRRAKGRPTNEPSLRCCERSQRAPAARSAGERCPSHESATSTIAVLTGPTSERSSHEPSARCERRSADCERWMAAFSELRGSAEGLGMRRLSPGNGLARKGRRLARAPGAAKGGPFS